MSHPHVWMSSSANPMSPSTSTNSGSRHRVVAGRTRASGRSSSPPHGAPRMVRRSTNGAPSKAMQPRLVGRRCHTPLFGCSHDVRRAGSPGPAPVPGHRVAGHERDQLTAEERRIHVEKLAVLAVLDERHAWPVTTRSVMVCPSRRARELDTARALESLPEVAAAAYDGRLSAEQLAPVVELADEDTDAEWARGRQGAAPGDLARLARQARVPSYEEGLRRRAARRMWIGERPETGMVDFGGSLADLDGVYVKNVFDTMIERMRPAKGKPWDSRAHRMADALVELCRHYEGCDTTDRATMVQPLLVVQVPIDGPAEVGGVPLPDEMVAELRASAEDRARPRRRPRRPSPSARCAPHSPPRSCVRCSPATATAAATAAPPTASTSTTSPPSPGAAPTTPPTSPPSAASATPVTPPSSPTATGSSKATPTSPTASTSSTGPKQSRSDHHPTGSPPADAATAPDHPAANRPNTQPKTLTRAPTARGEARGVEVRQGRIRGRRSVTCRRARRYCAAMDFILSYPEVTGRGTRHARRRRPGRDRGVRRSGRLLRFRAHRAPRARGQLARARGAPDPRPVRRPRVRGRGDQSHPSPHLPHRRAVPEPVPAGQGCGIARPPLRRAARARDGHRLPEG